jgi:undecaprenyl-diphosphatase
MTATEVLILSLTQGITEFLPVSSSGHLLVARLWLHIPDIDGTAVDAFLHLGTVGAVLVYYWRTWVSMGSALLGEARPTGRQTSGEARDKRELIGKLIVATIPGAVVGYLFQDIIENTLRGPHILALSFLFTAVILWWFDRAKQQPAVFNKGRASWGDALVIGLCQILALVPAISRSAVTIAAGRARGLSRQQATTFSFLMSAPIIAGASLSSLTNLLHTGSVSGGLLMLGTVVSFVSGLASIYLLMRFIERISLKPFAIYLVILSAIIWMTAL